MAAATPDGRDAGPDEITLAEDEWPVSDLYRVDPAELEAGPRDRDPREDTTAVVRDRVRRRPPFPFHDDRIAALALAILAAIVLAVAAGWYVANGEESADATPPAGAATGRRLDRERYDRSRDVRRRLLRHRRDRCRT